MGLTLGRMPRNSKHTGLDKDNQEIVEWRGFITNKDGEVEGWAVPVDIAPPGNSVMDLGMFKGTKKEAQAVFKDRAQQIADKVEEERKQQEQMERQTMEAMMGVRTPQAQAMSRAANRPEDRETLRRALMEGR